jgi:hypothetical protein
MKCVICKKGPMQGVSLYRINEKGKPGLWACRAHRSQTDAPVDPELDEIVSRIEGKR